jgi:hypothetical protein
MTGVAWVFLVVFDVLRPFGFGALYGGVRRFPTRKLLPFAPDEARAVRAVAVAAALYIKPAYCLQRSAALTCLMRLLGVQARLVIGFRPTPLDSHAWVEVDGRIVNDRPQYQRRFVVLDTL